MRTANRKPATIAGRMVADRRSGINRRVVTYDWHVPERRGLADRRQVGIKAGASHAAWRVMRR